MYRKLRLTTDREAVSVVIGVTLMVAVAIAMGAVAYAYMTGMIGGKTTEVTPIVDFTAKYDENSLLLTYKEVDTNWEDFRILAEDDQGDIKYFQNGSNGPRFGVASVGDKVYINDDGSDDINGTVYVTVTYIPSNTVMGVYTFEDVT